MPPLDYQSDLFRSSEQEFIDYSNVIETSIAKLNSTKGDNKRNMIQKIKKKLQQADKAVCRNFIFREREMENGNWEFSIGYLALSIGYLALSIGCGLLRY